MSRPSCRATAVAATAVPASRPALSPADRHADPAEECLGGETVGISAALRGTGAPPRDAGARRDEAVEVGQAPLPRERLTGKPKRERVARGVAAVVVALAGRVARTQAPATLSRLTRHPGATVRVDGAGFAGAGVAS